MRLYGYWRSGASWRVRLALELKGLAYENVVVHLLNDGGQQHAPEHQARNALEQVPVLEVGGVQLTQSLAIITYLEAAHPEPALLPTDPFLRARAWQVAEICNAGLQPLHNLTVLKSLDALGADRKAWVRPFATRAMTQLERILAETTGAHAIGDAAGLADVCLVPQVYSLRRFGLDLTPYPTVLRVEAACEGLPAFRAAHPSAQPDAVN